MSPCCFCPNILPKTMMHIVVDTPSAFKTQKNVLGSLQSALAAGQIWSFNDFFVPLFTLTELKSSKTLTLASDENHINHVLLYFASLLLATMRLCFHLFIILSNSNSHSFSFDVREGEWLGSQQQFFYFKMSDPS